MEEDKDIAFIFSKSMINQTSRLKTGTLMQIVLDAPAMKKMKAANSLG